MIVCIYRIVLQVENGMSSTGNVEIAFIRTTGWNIRDAKFVDDEELVLAVSDNGKQQRPILSPTEYTKSFSKLHPGYFDFPTVERPPDPLV